MDPWIHGSAARAATGPAAGAAASAQLLYVLYPVHLGGREASLLGVRNNYIQQQQKHQLQQQL